MEHTNFNDLSPEIKAKVLQAKEAQIFLNEAIVAIAHFPIHDRRMSAAAHSIAISGVVDDDETKQAIHVCLSELPQIKQVINTLTVYKCTRKIKVLAKGETFFATNLAELQTVLGNLRRRFIRVCPFDENGQELNVRMNETHATAIMYDNVHNYKLGCTHNPHYQGSDSMIFLNEEGKWNRHPLQELVENRDGFDIMRHFLLTGKLYDGVNWR